MESQGTAYWLAAHQSCAYPHSDPFIVSTIVHTPIQNIPMNHELFMRTNLDSMIVSVLCQRFKLKACDLILKAPLMHEFLSIRVPI